LGRNLEKAELLAWKAKHVQLKEICFENDHFTFFFASHIYTCKIKVEKSINHAHFEHYS